MTGFGAESRPQIDAGRHPDATEATNVAGGATGVRCLVLVPRGERVEPILRESFAKRGISTVACDDPFALVARPVDRGNRALHLATVILNTTREQIACVTESMLVHVDFSTRRPVPFPDDVAAVLDASLAEAAGLRLPLSGALGIRR